VGGGGGANVKEQNTRAKRANLSEGRGAKPQVQNGWLGCRLERGTELLFGGIRPKGNSFLRGQSAGKEGPIVKEMRITQNTINHEGKEVKEK
jgi:hypothetical protein